MRWKITAEVGCNAQSETDTFFLHRPYYRLSEHDSAQLDTLGETRLCARHCEGRTLMDVYLRALAKLGMTSAPTNRVCDQSKRDATFHFTAKTCTAIFAKLKWGAHLPSTAVVFAESVPQCT
jgi:hypothetical protein